MFFKLVFRNSKRSWRENFLFMSALIVSVIAFYVALSLENQDVVRYLYTLESDAVNKLVVLVGGLYCFTLSILFFLIYYASKYQIERRSHELGVYLMMGMKRSRLLSMLLTEDITSSLVSLIIGLPVSLLLTEVMSLLTAKVVGIGFIGHESTFSLRACGLACLGFFAIKLFAFIILSFKLAGKEIGVLLADAPENIKKQKHPAVYCIASIIGLMLLGVAYSLAIFGMSFQRISYMYETLMTGLVGTYLLFWGLRFFMDKLAKRGGRKQLHVFNFRQVQDTVIYRSGTLAICSILLLAAMVCLGCGMGTFFSYDLYSGHCTDYTFHGDHYDPDSYEIIPPKTADEISDELEKLGLRNEFEHVYNMRIGYIRSAEDPNTACNMDDIVRIEDEMDPDHMYHAYNMDTFPHIICLSDYNDLLRVAGREELVLKNGEVSAFMDKDVVSGELREFHEKAFAKKPKVTIDGDEYVFDGNVLDVDVVTDYMITLSFAIIVPDYMFEKYTTGDYDCYVNGVLTNTDENVLSRYERINDALNKSDIDYESYLNNMGRQLFYLVAASYITLYLAVIFFIIANTILGVQFLMGQKKSHKRYGTLIKLGAEIETLCKSSAQQINWFFGIPLIVAITSSMFGIRALYTGILSSRTKAGMSDMMLISLGVIVVFCLVECIYIWFVKRSSYRFLRTLMTPEREE